MELVSKFKKISKLSINNTLEGLITLRRILTTTKHINKTQKDLQKICGVNISHITTMSKLGWIIKVYQSKGRHRFYYYKWVGPMGTFNDDIIIAIINWIKVCKLENAGDKEELITKARAEINNYKALL